MITCTVAFGSFALRRIGGVEDERSERIGRVGDVRFVIGAPVGPEDPPHFGVDPGFDLARPSPG